MGARRAAALGALLAISGCDSKPPTEPSLPPPHLISGAVSVAAACTADSPSAARPAEPSLATDPRDPRQLVVGWLESASGTVIAVSHDGGETWARSPLPSLLICAGGRYARTSDPWVSIGQDGVTYVAVLATRPAAPAGLARDIVVTVSRDHGASWETPVVVESATAPPTQPDKETILADPRRPAGAYAVWVDYRVTTGIEPTVTQVMFSRTNDGGRTWSAPAAIYSGNDEAQQNQLLMTAGGVLLDVFVEAPALPFAVHPPPLPVRIRLMRSTDQGKTWSAPVDAASFTYTIAVDPGTGAPLRFSGQHMSAASAGNAVYVSWFEDHNDFSTIFVARSEDAGVHWRQPQQAVREKAEAFLPTLAVAGDATVGLLWFDFRHFKQGSPRLDTDVWFSTSRDRGVHWTERRAAGPFDLRAVPGSRTGPFIGDYMGLVGLPDGFAATFVLGKPLSRNGPTDIFFSRIAG
ncbi:MAG: glycoside hydrolase [Candidatus Dormibacteraeota bacterium]|nr:glycoside hydrolase [Candidatus Dormibacteraeota bacterium]